MGETLETEVLLKASRISFIPNYILTGLVLVFLVLLINAFDLKFALLPKTPFELYSSMIILLILAVGASFAEQPEWKRFFEHYIVTYNEVIEEKGILSKHKIILPYQSVADVRVERSFFGRILNYGNVFVSGFKAGSDIEMKGIRHPQKIHEMVQNRVNMIREGQMQFFKKKEE